MRIGAEQILSADRQSHVAIRIVLALAALVFVWTAAPSSAEISNRPDLAGLAPPPSDVPRSAVSLDESAPYCTPEESRGDPSGFLVEHAWLVLHLCRDVVGGFEPGNEGPERLYVNHARVPGLTFEHYPGRVWLTDFATYDQSLRGKRVRHPHLDRHERHGGALYEVWHNPDPPIYDRSFSPWIEIMGPSPYPFGNLYVFVPEPSTAGLPVHFVRCHAEPMNIWEDEPSGCLVHVDYRGRNAFVRLFGSGPGYAEDSGYVQMHPLFPHFTRDIYTLLSAVDVTDDPEAQACVTAGGDYRAGQCDER